MFSTQIPLNAAPSKIAVVQLIEDLEKAWNTIVPPRVQMTPSSRRNMRKSFLEVRSPYGLYFVAFHPTSEQPVQGSIYANERTSLITIVVQSQSQFELQVSKTIRQKLSQIVTERLNGYHLEWKSRQWGFYQGILGPAVF
ncbi:MAG: hypothetical protein KDK99_11815 [Verrucomicrobiales bacterium]|nr:hypothetical protein [Verrucomicrobiales bacterium]